MSGRYLTDLASVLRAAGCTVVELSGWQTRARSSGGYNGAPWCVMWHHTASGGNGASDAQYCTYSASDRPVCNLVIGRDGTVYVCAAGCTNTNGRGGSYRLPDGRTVPQDSMNTRAVGIEISNNGVGQSYPQAQIDACFAASNAIAAAYIDAKYDNVVQHVDWSPGRKIDPATAAAVEGGWKPRSTNSSGSWNLDDLRAECRRRATTTPAPSPAPPTPPIQEDDMVLFAARTTEADGSRRYWIGDGITRRRVTGDWSNDFYQLQKWGVGPIVIPLDTDPRATPPPARVTSSGMFTDIAHSTLAALGDEAD